MPLREFRCKKCGRLLAKISEKGYEALKNSDDAYIEIYCCARGYKPAKYISELKSKKCDTLNVFPERLERL